LAGSQLGSPKPAVRSSIKSVFIQVSSGGFFFVFVF
jgi:hypothetical protein